MAMTILNEKIRTVKRIILPLFSPYLRQHHHGFIALQDYENPVAQLSDVDIVNTIRIFT